MIETLNFYKELFNKSNAIMLVFDTEDFRIVDVNYAACEFYGYTYEEFKSLHIYDLNKFKTELLKNKLNDFIKNN